MGHSNVSRGTKVLLLLLSFVTITPNSVLSLQYQEKSNFRKLRMIGKPLTKPCKILAVALLNIPSEGPDIDQEQFKCELDEANADGILGMSYPIQAEDGQTTAMLAMLKKGELVIGKSFLDLPNVVFKILRLEDESFSPQDNLSGLLHLLEVNDASLLSLRAISPSWPSRCTMSIIWLTPILLPSCRTTSLERTAIQSAWLLN